VLVVQEDRHETAGEIVGQDGRGEELLLVEHHGQDPDQALGVDDREQPTLRAVAYVSGADDVTVGGLVRQEPAEPVGEVFTKAA
jgi:hypothetical protein